MSDVTERDPSIAKQVSVRALRVILYPPGYALSGGFFGIGVSVFLMIWIGLAGLFFTFDFGRAAGIDFTACVGIGLVGGFLYGLFLAFTEEVE